MAFLIIFTYYIINSNSAFDLIIWGYIPNINNIGTNLLRLIVLLIALNTIYSAIFLLILRILTAII